MPFADAERLLNSSLAWERTLGTRHLAKAKTDQSAGVLCAALIHEEKLYTKIEICHALVETGKPAIDKLISLLGKIGHSISISHKRKL